MSRLWQMKVWGLSEIGRAYGVSPQAANKWSADKAFPKPYEVLGSGRIWKRPAVERWVIRHRPAHSARHP